MYTPHILGAHGPRLSSQSLSQLSVSSILIAQRRIIFLVDLSPWTFLPLFLL